MINNSLPYLLYSLPFFFFFRSPEPEPVGLLCTAYGIFSVSSRSHASPDNGYDIPREGRNNTVPVFRGLEIATIKMGYVSICFDYKSPAMPLICLKLALSSANRFL